LNTSFAVTNGFLFRLPLVHALGVSSPGGRWEVLFILGPAGNFSCFFNGFSSPDYLPLTDINDRPPTPTREISSWQRPSNKKKYLSAIPEQGRRT
jgi:hypothetical protein